MSEFCPNLHIQIMNSRVSVYKILSEFGAFLNANFHVILGVVFAWSETKTTTIVECVYVHNMFEVMEFSKKKVRKQILYLHIQLFYQTLQCLGILPSLQASW